jgi:TPR repeat protein
MNYKILILLLVFFSNSSIHAAVYAEEKLKKTIKIAEEGNAESQFRLGVMYYYGTGGVKKDRTQSAKWYRKAAIQGHSSAKFNLGKMYSTGSGVKKDSSLGAMWIRKAAKQEQLKETNKAYSTSFEMNLIGAKNGKASSQYNIGQMYQFGNNVQQDHKEAIRWYKAAAAQGDSSAQVSLGGCYDNGIGVEQDKQMAITWFFKAANQGHPAAQYNLGIKYFKGEGGLKQDYPLAAEWFRKAAKQGHTSATRILPAIEKKLDP